MVWYRSGDDFDWWKVGKKFITGLLIVLLPIILGYICEFLETETFPPEYAAYIAILTAVFHALANLVKHWNDGK